MRAAKPEELQSPALPVIEARVTPGELIEIFPVQFQEIDALSEPEPSKGALVKLDSGRYVVVVYGLKTGSLILHLPEREIDAQSIEALLREIPLITKSIVWRRLPAQNHTHKKGITVFLWASTVAAFVGATSYLLLSSWSSDTTVGIRDAVHVILSGLTGSAASLGVKIIARLLKRKGTTRDRQLR